MRPLNGSSGVRFQHMIRPRLACRRTTAAPARAPQLLEAALHHAHADRLAGLLGVLEDVDGEQVADLLHAHGASVATRARERIWAARLRL
jgi:hypothetical protein